MQNLESKPGRQVKLMRSYLAIKLNYHGMDFNANAITWFDSNCLFIEDRCCESHLLVFSIIFPFTNLKSHHLTFSTSARCRHQEKCMAKSKQSFSVDVPFSYRTGGLRTCKMNEVSVCYKHAFKTLSHDWYGWQFEQFSGDLEGGSGISI